jgi:hypothetical protein
MGIINKIKETAVFAVSKLKLALRSIKPYLIYIVFGIYLGYLYPNPNSYFEVDRVWVTNESTIYVGDIIEMDSQRIIKKDFEGHFFVKVVRYSEETMGWETYCTGDASIIYKTTAVLPNPGPDDDDLNLKWWLWKNINRDDCKDGKIDNPGKYKILTDWKIDRPFAFPMWVSNETEVFPVKEKK